MFHARVLELYLIAFYATIKLIFFNHLIENEIFHLKETSFSVLCVFRLNRIQSILFIQLHKRNSLKITQRENSKKGNTRFLHYSQRPRGVIFTTTCDLVEIAQYSGKVPLHFSFQISKSKRHFSCENCPFKRKKTRRMVWPKEPQEFPKLCRKQRQLSDNAAAYCDMGFLSKEKKQKRGFFTDKLF